MGYSVIQQGDTVQYTIYEVEVDTLADIDTLPKTDKWAAGSVAICLEDSSVWMLGTDDIWHEI